MRRCFGSLVLLLSFILSGNCYSETSYKEKSKVTDIKKCRSENCPDSCQSHHSTITDESTLEESGKCAVKCSVQVVS